MSYDSHYEHSAQTEDPMEDHFVPEFDPEIDGHLPEQFDLDDPSLPSSRVPNLGHAILFVSFAGLLLFLTQLVAISTAHTAHDANASAQILSQPKRQLASMAVTYLVTLGSSFLIFPLFWRRSFLSGIDWHGARALRLSLRLISLGLSVGWMVQAVSSLIPVPKSMPMDNFFRTAPDIWLVTLFGTLLAPLFEEITFRGFMLPAFAIAFDWLGPVLQYVFAFSIARLKKQEPSLHIATFGEARSAGLAEDTGNLFFRSKLALISASVVTSVLFALIHADQLAHAWAAVGILFGVSLILTLIRIQTKSVACSTLVHASYNFSVFLTVFLATGGYRHIEKLAH